MKKPSQEPTAENPIYITCKDYTVSGEEFNLIYDEEKQMLFTSPKPDIKSLSHYYKSEDYISHTDSKKSLTDKLYHLVKQKMIQKKLKWIRKKSPKGKRLLDFGAGTGEFLLMAKKSGWKVSGVEPEEKARLLSEKKGIKLQKDLSGFPSEKFDVITLWHVLEHLPDLKNKIVEFQHLLKKGGVLVIAVPNFKSYDAMHYKQFWAAYDVPRHLWHFSRNSFSHLLAGNSFRQIDSKPLIFDSFYVSLLSEKYKTGHANFLKALLVGIKSNWKAKFNGEYSSICYFFRKEL